jgi:hypothetical protein
MHTLPLSGAEPLSNFTNNMFANRRIVSNELCATGVSPVQRDGHWRHASGTRQIPGRGTRQLGIHMMLVVVAFVSTCLTTGCQLSGASSFSFLPTPPKCVLPPDMTKQELIRHLNHNANRVHSWQSTDVEIGTAGVLFKMSAVIAVQQPRNFRLRAGLATGNEADLGSNPDRFWFWMRRSPDKYVLTSSHEQAGQVQKMMKFPFQPDWLMETLGVIPLDESQFTMQSQTGPDGVVHLVSDQTTQTGESVRRVVLVDMCRGYIIAHELYDAQNRLIARAELNDYKLDAKSGAALPHRIDLDWPQARLALTMKIGEIDVNPAAIPEQTWQVPHIRGYPVLDLGKMTRPAEPAGRSRVSAGSIQEATATELPPWAEQSSVAPDQNLEPAGRPLQTAEAPPWDDEPDTTQWRPRNQPASPGNSVKLMSQNSAEEPPWDESSPATAAPGTDPRRRNDARGQFGGPPTDYASSNEEPPWDNTQPPHAKRRSAKPTSVLDFLKAPFARFARRQ